MNEILERALLFDFYGELLTDHQKEIYGTFIQDDLSLGELAQEAGISRQGVHDLIRRCDRILKGYEAKLHLMERFLSIKDQVQEIDDLLDAYIKEPEQKDLDEVRSLAGEILDEL